MTRSRSKPRDEDITTGKDPQLEDTDGAFSYSQKYFHISDGNLYSIFSPLQGRSYGVKPSFLRRQRCMVHQSKGKGHKQSRRLLKFHNFIPSESVISEREDSHELWKVHGECRLREEHGTKQIMVTNWSHSAASLPSANDVPSQEPNALQTSSPCISPPATECESSVTPSDCTIENCDIDVSETADANRKHRRKPTVTKRVVPYLQYLSMMDGTSNDSPLDLTCRITQLSDADNNDSTTPFDNSVTQKDTVEEHNTMKEATSAQGTSKENATLFFNPIEALPNYATSMGILVQTPCAENASQYVPSCSTLQSLLTGHVPSYNQYQKVSCGASAAVPTGECSKEEAARVPKMPRKPSHRTIIRKKLEDTFRQNGFLVKTKQVSDGDATFCKFKQLRKYTRYYLKSWHQHLPEEVHKLWKGFLPPKSNLSPGKKDN